MATETPPAKHIRLTSHPVEDSDGVAPIHWGRADPRERGPVVGSTSNRSQRNVIGTHSGRYGVYRALAVAAGALTARPPAPTSPTPRRPIRSARTRSGATPTRSCRSIRRRASVADVFARRHRAGLRHPADDRGHQGAHRPAGDARRRSRPDAWRPTASVLLAERLGAW